MQTKEEYSKRSFKKKYKFEPNRDNRNIGKIKVDGKEYKVSINSKDTIVVYAIERINLNEKFFKLKGSSHNKRRDAVLQHEIGHIRLHSTDVNNINLDMDKRSIYIYRDIMSRAIIKNKKRIELTGDEKYDILYGYYANRYAKDIDINKQNERNKAYDKAKKYENKYVNFNEFEADRYAANRTSKSAVKKAMMNMYKLENKYKDKKYNIKMKNIMIQRFKALEDKDLQKSNIYK